MSELDYWSERLTKGALSRREFIGRAAALGASSLAISTRLAHADAVDDETPVEGGPSCALASAAAARPTASISGLTSTR